MTKYIRRGYVPLPNTINKSKRNFSNCSIEQILKYWEVNIGKSDDQFKKIIDWGEPECFACGYTIPDASIYIRENLKQNCTEEEYWKIISIGWHMLGLQYCHIHAHCFGGNEHYSNIVLLCSFCHKLMDIKFLGKSEDRDSQLDWIKNFSTTMMLNHKEIPLELINETCRKFFSNKRINRHHEPTTPNTPHQPNS